MLHLFHEAAEVGVARGMAQMLVKLQVQIGNGTGVVPLVGAFHLVIDLFKLLQLVRSHAGRCQPGREAVQDLAYEVEREDIIGCQGGDPGSLIWRSFDEPIRSQDLKGLAHRRAANAEVSGEFFLTQPGSG